MKNTNDKENIPDKVGEAVRDLMRQHSTSIVDAMQRAETTKITVAFSVKIQERGADKWSVKTKISYGTKNADEREDTVDGDKSQTKLNIEEGAQ